MKQALTLAALAATFSAPAIAGTLSAPVTEAALVMAIPVAQGGEWTGAYGGLQLGYGSLNGSGGLEGDGAIGGLTFGYDHDFGQYVLGAGVDYDFANIDFGGATTLENVARLKVRAGYDMGDGLLYATAGGAQAQTSSMGSDTGWFGGVGYEHKLTQNISVGGEVLYHQFDDFNGSGTDLDATTAQIRTTFRF